jgi:prepilin-type N-terminal cleavage/methylation domain-containing protein
VNTATPSLSRLPKRRDALALRKGLKAFSLVEVVVALGIFAIAVVACVGLLGPINASVSEISDSDAASRVIDRVQAELQRLGPVTVNGYIGSATALYASRGGDKLGVDGAPIWGQSPVPDLDGNPTANTTEEVNAQKHFQVVVNANPTKPNLAATDGYLLVNLELRWPAYTADGRVRLQGEALEQQNLLVVPVAIPR